MKAKDLLHRAVKLRVEYTTASGTFAQGKVFWCAGVCKYDFARVRLATLADKRKIVIDGAWVQDLQIVTGMRNPSPEAVKNPGAFTRSEL